MNLFGLDVRISKKNSQWVSEEVCQVRNDSLKQSIRDLKEHIDIRFDDLKDRITMKGV